jgi:uncharacterized membrane protein
LIEEETVSRSTDIDVVARRIRVLGRPAFGGLLIALLFWLPALTPTLIPRTPTAQVGINAVILAIAYGIGALVGLCIRLLFLGGGRSAGPGVRRIGWIVLGVGWLVGGLFGAVLWVNWQNDQRSFMGMETVDAFDAVLMVSLSVVGGAGLVVVGRLISRLVLAVVRLSRRLLPSVPVAPAVGLTILLVGVGLVGWAAWQGIVAFANATYGSANASTDEGIEQPDSASVSGSSESLVAWDTLGRWGRNFVASATTAEDLEAFHGAVAELSEPVRVYVGLDSAGSASERAELAVRELDRAGGFDREVLVVWVPTGTGWMIPEAADALELLHRGDTAIVATQYSFLPSLLAVFMEPGREIEAGSALYSAVHSHWLGLPPDQRPQLVLFGKSLGTVGVETPFVGADASASIANLLSGADGALIVGAKRTNPIHSQLTQERDPGSPVWQPIVDGGRSVRFLSQDPDQPDLGQWALPRIVYLQHPSDPVPFWGIDALWRPPEWMDQPRGFDVPEAASWYPIVTGVHAAVDLIFQLDTPPGFGHVYATEYVEGWGSVIPPDGWTDADTARLEEFVGREPPSEEQP